jgi:hypothetical protein
VSLSAQLRARALHNNCLIVGSNEPIGTAMRETAATGITKLKVVNKRAHPSYKALRDVS